MAFLKWIGAAAFVSVTALSVAAPGFAQSSAMRLKPIAKADQPYFDLYDAIIGGLDLNQVAELGADAAFDGIVRNNAGFGNLAKGQPGLKGEFRTIAKPYLMVWVGRAFSWKRARVVVKLKEQLTPNEASELAAFYRSSLGRKVMSAISSNISGKNTVDSAIRRGGTNIDKAAIRADEADTMSAALQDLLPSLTEAEQKQLVAISKTSAFRKLEAVSESMAAVPEPSFEEISTAQERESFGLAVRDLFTRAQARQ